MVLSEKSQELRQGLTWWLGELGDMVPAALISGRRKRVVIETTDDRLEAYAMTPQGAVSLGSVSGASTAADIARLKSALDSLNDGQTVFAIRLAPSRVLVREIEFPGAAREVLEPVISNQMDQLTPWPQRETVFGYEIVDDTGEQDPIKVRVVATSRKIMADAIQNARRVGVEPALVEYSDDPTSSQAIRLHGSGDVVRARLPGKIATVLGSLLVAALVVGAIGVFSLVSQTMRLNELRADISQNRAALTSIDALSANTRELREQLDQLIRKKNNQAAVIVAIEALTRAIPDSAWLTNLEVRGDKLRLQGQADNAPSLIAALEGLANFTDVQFSAPTTRRENERQETFSITARIMPVNLLDEKS